MVPVRRFPGILRYLSLERSMRLAGIGPPIDVEMNLIICSAVKEVIEGGIVPLIETELNSIL
jgi:hypothetical protein